MSPEHLLAHAQSLKNSRRIQEAIVAFEKLKGLYPKFPPILNDLGILYLEQGKLESGVTVLEKSIQVDSSQASTYYNLGRAYQMQGNFKKAATAYNKATKLQPQMVDAFFNEGLSLFHLEQFNEASEIFERLTKLHPNSAEALNALGICLYHLKDYEESLSILKKALLYNNLSPEIHNNIGLALHKFNRFEEAIDYYSKAILINPQYADALSNRALTYQAIQKTDDALADLDRCIAINPQHTDAHWNKALVHLLRGEYKEGWTGYEWRWQSYSKKWRRKFSQPTWLGQFPLKDKTIFVYPEQGLGDFIQFCRYVPMLSQAGANVILEAPKPLIDIAKTLEGNIKVIEPNGSPGKFDYQAPLLSLPLAFGTSLESIPNKVPYLFADKRKIEIWQTRLGDKTSLRVGIAWSGAAGQANDHNRSMRLEAILPLLELPFEYHLLQKEVREADEDLLKKSKIRDHRSHIEDFSDTAALIESMDFVISVDTSVAHLAGALNKKMLVLLAFNAEYRWLLIREDYPWYPSVTLLRQSKIGEWDKPLNKLIEIIK